MMNARVENELNWTLAVTISLVAAGLLIVGVWATLPVIDEQLLRNQGCAVLAVPQHFAAVARSEAVAGGALVSVGHVPRRRVLDAVHIDQCGS